MSITVRSTRTIVYGLLLGFFGGALSLLGMAVVRQQGTLRLGADMPERVKRAAGAAIPALAGGPEWRMIRQIGTPWEEVVRLRPFVRGVEVRGADCLVHLPRSSAHDGSSGVPPSRASSPDGRADPLRPDYSFERDPASIGWLAVDSMLAVAGKSADLAERAGTAIRSRFDSRSLSASEPFVELGTDPVHPFGLAMEVTLAAADKDLERLLSGLPWGGAIPEPVGPIDLHLELDPVTLEPIEVRDLRFTVNPTGRAMVFDPNPVATSGNAGLRNGDPVDGYRSLVPVPRLDGEGQLHGRWVEVRSDRAPHAKEAGLFFDYPSYDPRFEEVMAYVHGDRALARVDSLGFTGLFSRPLSLRVHATEMDNSWYSRPTREILFGDGGVDDAEDADIILHEVGHAIHDALAPGFGNGDTRALSEGFGDFWAASLTDGACIGDWDATAYSPPCLRRVDEAAVYPSWLNGRPHHDGAIWSGLFWDLRAEIGRDDAERLALAAMLEAGTAASWEQAAQAVVRAAGRVGLAHQLPEISTALAARGLAPREVAAHLGPGESCTIDLTGAARFLDQPVSTLSILGDGRLVFSRGGLAASVPFPQGPPTALPCSPVANAEATTLDARAVLSAARGEVTLCWRLGAADLCRVDATWNPRDGSLEWEYRQVQPPGDQLQYLVGASQGEIAPEVLAEPRLDALPAEGISALQGFRVTLNSGDEEQASLPLLLGARYRIESEEGMGGFRLTRRAPPLSPGKLDLAAQPNPFRQSVEIRFLKSEPGPARLELFDLLGRRVRGFTLGEGQTGLASFYWDGRDESGRPLPSGTYWARAVLGSGRAATRIMLVR